jgi:hypothetical protein
VAECHATHELSSRSISISRSPPPGRRPLHLTHPHPFDTNATLTILMQTQDHNHSAHSPVMNPAHPGHPAHPAPSLGDELHDADDASFDEPRGFRGRLGERLESKTTHRVVLSLVSGARHGLESGGCTRRRSALLHDHEESPGD